MNASIPGSKDWWTVVLSMPHYEALEQLHAYRAQIIEENQHRSSSAAVAATLTRLSVETKRINTLRDNSHWHKACRDVLTPELYDAVTTRKQLLEKAA